MSLIPISQHEQAALLAQAGQQGLYVPLQYTHGSLPHLDTEDAPGAWAIDALTELRANERALAGELNLAVETRLRDDLHELLAEEFADEIRHERLDLVGQRLADQLTTAVFEAMQTAGFTIVRKAG